MMGGGGGGLAVALATKKPKTTANFKFRTVFFFSIFPFWPILAGLTGSDLVVLCSCWL